MASRGFSHAVLVGNIGSAPELRYTSNGHPVLGFSLAVNRWVPDNDDGVADWYRISIWGKRSETAEKLLTVGDKVLVEGRLQLSEYETKSGEARTSVELHADSFELMTPPRRTTNEK